MRYSFTLTVALKSYCETMFDKIKAVNDLKNYVNVSKIQKCRVNTISNNLKSNNCEVVIFNETEKLKISNLHKPQQFFISYIGKDDNVMKIISAKRGNVEELVRALAREKGIIIKFICI